MARFVHDEERSSPLNGTDNGGNGDNIIGTSSRPHSSTSAELENISAITIQPPIVQPPVPIRTKETRCVFCENMHVHNILYIIHYVDISLFLFQI